MVTLMQSTVFITAMAGMWVLTYWYSFKMLNLDNNPPMLKMYTNQKFGNHSSMSPPVARLQSLQRNPLAQLWPSKCSLYRSQAEVVILYWVSDNITERIPTKRSFSWKIRSVLQPDTQRSLWNLSSLSKSVKSRLWLVNFGNKSQTLSNSDSRSLRCGPATTLNLVRFQNGTCPWTRTVLRPPAETICSTDPKTFAKYEPWIHTITYEYRAQVQKCRLLLLFVLTKYQSHRELCSISCWKCTKC